MITSNTADCTMTIGDIRDNEQEIHQIWTDNDDPKAGKGKRLGGRKLAKLSGEENPDQHFGVWCRRVLLYREGKRPHYSEVVEDTQDTQDTQDTLEKRYDSFMEMTTKRLRELIKERGVKGFSRATKADCAAHLAGK